MTLVPKQQPTFGYNTIADGNDEDETDVPLVPPTSFRSHTKDDGHRGRKKTGYEGPLIVAVVLTLMLGLSRYYAGGGPSDGGSLNHSGGNLVDSTAYV